MTKKLKADRSDQHILKFTVFAEDDSQPPCVVPGTIEITVDGVNDNDPEICYMGQCNLKSFKVCTYFFLHTAGFNLSHNVSSGNHFLCFILDMTD